MKKGIWFAIILVIGVLVFFLIKPVLNVKDQPTGNSSNGIIETKDIENLLVQNYKEPIIIDKSIDVGSLLGQECQNISYLEETSDYIIEAGVSKVDINTSANIKVINLGIVAWLKGNKNTNALEIIIPIAEQGDSPAFEEQGVYRIYLWELNDKLYFTCEFAGVRDLGYRNWYCHETDGERNYFEGGSATVYFNGSIYGPYYDGCGGNILDEVTCNNERKFILSELYLCPNGCENNACVA